MGTQERTYDNLEEQKIENSTWNNTIIPSPSSILHFQRASDQFIPEPFEWTWLSGILSLILGVIILTTIFGNLFILYDFLTRVRKDVKIRTPTHFFIANLAFADFLVGVFVLPFLAVLQVTGRWYLGQCFCNIWVCSHFWLCASSILSTCAVCIERYIGVRYPIEHMRILNTRRILLMILLVWIMAGIPSITRVFAWTEPKIEIPYVCKINQKIGHAILACIGIFYTPGIIMVILYWRIYRIAARHMNAIKRGYLEGAGGLRYQVSIGRSRGKEVSEDNSSSSSRSTDTTTSLIRKDSIDAECNASQIKRQEVKAKKKSQPRSSESITKRQINLAKRLSFLVGILLLSYGPYFSLILVRSIDPSLVSEHLFNSFAWIRYFNSCINPFIYAYAVPTYHAAFTKLLKRFRFWN